MLKGKTCRKFGVSLWFYRNLTMKQRKNLLLEKKKMILKKTSNFATKLKSKQLVSALYGNLKLQTLKKNLTLSQKASGKNAHVFFSFLEKRLDSSLVQLKLAPTFMAAKQLINHKKVFINNKVMKSPGYLLKAGDQVSLDPSAHSSVKNYLTQILKKNVFFYKSLNFEVNYKTLQAIFLFSPQQIHYPTQIHVESVLKALL